MRRIAVIGAGISGLYAAHLLKDDFDVVVFEGNDYPGGHAHTVPVESEGKTLEVDTGFVVHNRVAYPNFVALLEELGVATRPASMSFSASCARSGVEWGGESLSGVFAQMRNLFRPSFLRMLRDVLRFGQEAVELLEPGTDDPSLVDYAASRGYSQRFLDWFLIPMSAAIWSADPRAIGELPARFFVQFFHHHQVLDIRRAPSWIAIDGGSARYVERLIAPFRDRLRLSTEVRSLKRIDGGVELISERHGAPEKERFDAAVVAVHSDQALAMLDAPTAPEREILGAIGYQPNEVVLHKDRSLMPRARRAWASWNYRIPKDPEGLATLTYHMNSLQSLPTREPILVSLNSTSSIDRSKIVQTFRYDHPLFTREALRAQSRHGEIDGHGGVYYCGAYWGFGFHEDGVDSAIAAVKDLRRDAGMPAESSRREIAGV